jgi:autotransporter-associated beta strand protein
MKPKSTARLSFPLASAIAALLSAPAAYADTRNWDGDTSVTWATAGNWDTLPANSLLTDIANFNLATYDGITVFAPNAGTTSINGITIGASNGPMTLTTTNLSIGGSGITIASGAGALTVGKVTIGAAQSWTNNDNDAATFNGANAFTNKLALAGGDFIFSGTNTGSGGIDLNAGKLIATVAGGFGPNTNTLKFGGGSLELRNDTATTYTGKIDMTTAGTTVTVNRATSGSGVTHTINQATTLGGGQTMVMSPGANITANTDYGLTLSGTKTLTGDSTYTINGNGSGAGTLSLTFGGFIPGLGNTRTLTLNNGTGTGANKALIAGRLAFDGNGGTMVLAGSAPVFFYNLIQQGTSVDAVEINSTTGGVYTASTDAFANTTSNFTGGLTLTSGTLNIPIAGDASKGPLGNGGTFTINGGIIDNSRGAAVVVANVNPITVGGDFAFSTAGGTALNNLTLPGTVNLGGTTRTITANGAGVLTLSGIISNGGLTKAGTGTLVLSNTAGNTYSGTTTINAGTLQAGAAAGGQAFGNGSAVTLADTAGATLNLNSFSQTIGSLAGGGTTGGNVTLGANATLTTGGNDTSTSYAGIISGTGTSGLTKTGNGTLSLNGTNTYTGATAIDAGTLLVNGSLAAGAVTVNGGTLGGTGTIGGAVTVNATGGVTPGASAGTLAITGNLTLTNLVAVATGKLKFELGANGIGTSDRITVGGNLILTDNNLNLADFQFISLAGLANGTYPLITYTGSITGGLDASNLIGTGNITGAGGTGDGTLQIDTDNKVVQLVVTNVSGGGSPYDTWASSKGLTGLPGSSTDPAKDADPDNDGSNNLAEFALDGNPLSGANDGKVVGKVATVGGNQVMTLTLPVRAVASFSPDSGDQLSALIDGVHYRIEGDVNLSTFADTITEVTSGEEVGIQAGLPALSAVGAPGWNYRTFRHSGTVPATPKAFLRAKISETP